MADMDREESTPKISVVIPAYNASCFITETLESVYSQSVPVHEVIVVDDGSTDETARVVEKAYPNVVLIRQANSGVSSARNTGIKNVSGEYICFLDADDLWFPDKIESQILALRDFPGSEFILTDELLFDDSGVYCESVLMNTTLSDFIPPGTSLMSNALTLLFTESFVSTSSVMVSASLVKSAGFFSEDLSIGEDREYWIKLALLSKPIFINRPLVKKRENHGGNISHISQLKWARGLSQVITSFDSMPVRQKMLEEGSSPAIVFSKNYMNFADIFWNFEEYEACKKYYRLALTNEFSIGLKGLIILFLPGCVLHRLRS